MAVLKCKICGGSLNVLPNSRMAVCEYCETKQVLPLFSDDSEQLLYDRANNYLSLNEYDKAENLFSQLLSLCPNDPEIYWDLVLCKYGVTFAKDPKTNKYIPTCNRTHFQSVFQDENYKKAIEYSDEEKVAYYKENATMIDNIQRGIISVFKKEKPYDIFISYKETDANGNRTKDSIKAQELYDILTKEGYKVFFSRITLEDKIGSEYEPHIYAALRSAKVMLTVCSSSENIESAWVKNEWSRFLTLRQEDSSKTLIPLYYDIPRSSLPDEFAILAAQEMNNEDFEQELIRGIKKLIPLPISKAEKRKRFMRVFSILFVILLILIIVFASIFIPQYRKEKDQSEKYQSAIELFNNAEYSAASKIFTELENYKDSLEMKERCDIQPKYDDAMNLYYDGKYAEATWALKALGDYQESEEYRQKSESKWRESLATVAIYAYSGSGGYYISANGSVESLDNEGTLNQNFEFDEHGKAVSLGTQHYFLNVLYEDGHLKGSDEDGKTIYENNDVVQVTTGDTYFALKNDGTVLTPDKICGNDIKYNCALDYKNLVCSNPIEKWENIIQLSEINDFKYPGGGRGWYCLIGEKSNGELEWAVSKIFDDYSDHLVQSDYFSSLTDDEKRKLFNSPDYYIDSKRNLKRCDDDSVIMENVVYFKEDYFVTQSGAIGTTFETYNLTDKKTRVYDVWLER